VSVVDLWSEPFIYCIAAPQTLCQTETLKKGRMRRETALSRFVLSETGFLVQTVGTLFLRSFRKRRTDAVIAPAQTNRPSQLPGSSALHTPGELPDITAAGADTRKYVGQLKQKRSTFDDT
jgi:hypothetical protein